MRLTRVASVLALISAPLLVSGCAFTDRKIQLSYTASREAKAAEAPTGSQVVLVQLLDERKERDSVGVVRNGFGAKTARVFTDSDVGKWVNKSISTELTLAGYQVVQAPARPETDQQPTITGEILQVMADGGAGGFGATAEVALRIAWNGRDLIKKTYHGEVHKIKGDKLASAEVKKEHWYDGYSVALTLAMRNIAEDVARELKREYSTTPAPASVAAPAAAAARIPVSTPISTPPALPVGTKLFSNDGALFGTVVLTSDTGVAVSLVGGGTVTMTMEQAIRMKDHVTATPPATPPAPAPTAAAVPAAASARTATPAPKSVPPPLAIGTKLFNSDGSLFGTVTILSKSAVAVLQANGYSTVTVSREQAVTMQR